MSSAAKIEKEIEELPEELRQAMAQLVLEGWTFKHLLFYWGVWKPAATNPPFCAALELESAIRQCLERSKKLKDVVLYESYPATTALLAEGVPEHARKQVEDTFNAVNKEQMNGHQKDNTSDQAHAEIYPVPCERGQRRR